MNMRAALVYLKDGKAWTDSVELAKAFDKGHDKVMLKIAKQLEDYSTEFVDRNFWRTTYEAPTNSFGVREYNMYRLSRDGFMAVAMTFTGKKAAAFREMVLAEFNRMEAKLVDVGLQPQELTINDLLRMTADKLQSAVDYAADHAEQHGITSIAIIKKYPEQSSKLIEDTKPKVKNLTKYGPSGILTVGLKLNGITSKVARVTPKGPALLFNTKEVEQFMEQYK
jgi:Rha family phage regulatory protein